MTDKAKSQDAAKYRAILESHGLRVTDPRLAVFELLTKAGKPLKAYEVLEKLSSPQHEVKPPTVYRALDALEEAGLIHKLESMNAFVCCHDHGHGHDQKHDVVFAICDTCETVSEIEQDSNSKLSHALNRQGFSPSKRIFEIHGECAKCKN